MPDWRGSEGELVAGEFQLEVYLAGDETSAVFLTRHGSGKAAIKLVTSGDQQALAEQWKQAARLSHSNLIRVFKTGTGAVGGMPAVYLVMEYADENLADVLAGRALTPEEALETLPPVADALAYLHGQGLAHGHLKASNVMAVNDTLKLSSDTIAPGDSAADLRALAGTMLYALTGRESGASPEWLPQPFLEVALHCLLEKPGWSAQDVATWLRTGRRPSAPLERPSVRPSRPPANKPAVGYYVAAFVLLAVVAATVAGMLMHRTAGPPSAGSATQTEVKPIPLPTPVPAPAPSRAARSKPVKPTPVPAQADPAQEPVASAPQPTPAPRPLPVGIVRQVLPEISQQARRTVHGKATVVVRVAVDPTGKVTDATVEREASSYFGNLTLEAARQWQFAPADNSGPRNWTLRFDITRSATRVTPMGPH
jgi:TonB family protein